VVDSEPVIQGRSNVQPGSLSRVRFFAIVAGPLFVLYLVTATWTTPYNMDSLTNALTAAEIADDGDPFLEEHEPLAEARFQGYAGWIVTAGDTAASHYPPGAAAVAAPFYMVWAEGDGLAEYTDVDGEGVVLPLPSLFPAAIASALVAAITVGLLALAFRLLAEDRLALAAAYLAGLGTGVWAVAADSLWQHGPAMMWLAAGMLLSISSGLRAGFAYGAALLTRPHTAVVAACNGLWISWQRRSIVPALKIAVGGSVGLAALIGYNKYVFGGASVEGGYGSSFRERLLSTDLLDFVGNALLGLVHPTSGLLIYTPFLLVLFFGIPEAWRKAPAWVQGSAIGGLVYLLIQWKANRYSGGGGFWGYRYPLEALAVAAPLLFLSYTEWVRKKAPAWVRKVFRWSAILSIELTALGALIYSTLWHSLVF